MIAITAQTRFDYTEPIPVDVNVNENLHVNEPEEKEDRSNFAELLAGLLQSTKTGMDDLIVDESMEGSNLDIFAQKLTMDMEGFTDIDLSDAIIEKEYQNIISAEHLFLDEASQELAANLNAGLDVKPQDQLHKQGEVLPKTETSLKDISPNVQEAQVNTASLNRADLNESNQRKNIDDALSSAGKKIDNNVKNEKVNVVPAENASLSASDKRDESQNQSMGRLDELRSRSRRDRASFEIRDLRTVSNTSTLNNAEMRPYALVETTAGRMPGHAPIQEITLELRLPDHGPGSQAQTTWDVKAGNAMENMLARELHQNFNGDIVRHASMVLKNGGEGLIKLNLRPDSLGNVKIHLELTENKITGRIFVESEEALNAFRKEIASLEQAFKDSGFAEANLNLSLTADGAGAEEQGKGEDSYTSQTVASSYENQEVAPIVDVLFGQRQGTVNMLA